MSLDHDQFVPANPVRKVLSAPEIVVSAFNHAHQRYIFRRVPVCALKILRLSARPLYTGLWQ